MRLFTKIISKTFHNNRKLLTFCKLSLFTPALSPFWVSHAGVFYYPACLLPSCLAPGALWCRWGSGIIARQLPSSTDPHNHARPDQNIRSDIIYYKWYDISIPYDPHRMRQTKSLKIYYNSRWCLPSSTNPQTMSSPHQKHPYLLHLYTILLRINTMLGLPYVPSNLNLDRVTNQ